MSDNITTGTAPSVVVPDTGAQPVNGAFTGRENETNPGSPPGPTPGATKEAPTDGEDKQPADGTKPEGEAADEAKAAGAPEKYEDFKAPEGVMLDSAVMTEFQEAARELNLPQDAAQKMVDKMAPIMAQRQADQMEQLRTDWMGQSKADKEFGGDKLNDSMAHAKKALDTFATPELSKLLDETGLGNHPELVRFMVRAGKAIGEDKIVTGGQPASAGKSVADRMYPDMSEKYKP